MSAHHSFTESYRPDGMRIGDVWFFDGPDGAHHVQYLQADEKLGPDQRHRTTIGQAVSTDYQNWQEVGTALIPGERGVWDDRTLWTGSVVVSQETGANHLFYTGLGERDPFAQKIGAAVSPDLIDWRKTTERPLVEAVKPYSTDTGVDRGFPAWRDPFVYYDERTKRYEMLITARLGDEPFNGCIARATSPNLDDWTIAAPLIAPGAYDEMEVPQIVVHDGDTYAFFSTRSKGYNPGWKEEVGGAWTGLHAYRIEGTDLSRPFRPVNGNGVVDDNGEQIYDIRLLQRIAGSNDYLAAGPLAKSPGTGEFVGGLSMPFIVTIDNGEVGVRKLGR